jgi:hypothetical protein
MIQHGASRGGRGPARATAQMHRPDWALKSSRTISVNVRLAIEVEFLKAD